MRNILFIVGLASLLTSCIQNYAVMSKEYEATDQVSVVVHKVSVNFNVSGYMEKNWRMVLVKVTLQNTTPTPATIDLSKIYLYDPEMNAYLEARTILPPGPSPALKLEEIQKFRIGPHRKKKVSLYYTFREGKVPRKMEIGGKLIDIPYVEPR